MKPRLAYRVTRAIVFYIFFIVTIRLAVDCGVHEKSWFEKSWDFLFGGGVGVLAGIAFFAFFGGVGLVSGGIYGALDLLGLATVGGTLGLGLGGVWHIISNPSSYVFDWPTIIFVMLIGTLLARLMAAGVARLFFGAPTTQQLTNKLPNSQ